MRHLALLSVRHDGPLLDPAITYETSLLRRIAVGALCAKIALIPLIFDPFALSAFAQPKTLASIAFDYVLLGMLAALALGHARSMLRWSPVHFPVLAFTAAYALATVFALDHRVALFGSADRGLGLIAVLDSVLLYIAVSMLFRTGTDVLWLGGSLAISTLVVVLYEGFQDVGADPVKWTRDASSGNLFATLGNRGVLAQFLGTVGVAACGVGLAPSAPARLRLLAGSLALLALAGALVSGGRAALLGIGVGIATLGVVRVIWEERPAARILGALAAAGLAVAVMGVATLTPTGQRVVAFLRDPGVISGAGLQVSDPSLAARLDLYRVAIEEWQDHPVLGVGPDNYAVAFARYRTPEGDRTHDFIQLQSSAHSWLAKLATDAGAVGTLSFLWAVVAGLVLTARGDKDPSRLAAAAGLAAFLGTGIVSVNHVATDWLPWLALALIAGPSSEPRTAPSPKKLSDHRRGRRFRSEPGLMSPVRGALMLAALVLAAASASGPLEAARQAKIALAAGTSGGVAAERAIRAARKAVGLDPGRAEYWYALGSLELHVGDARQAAVTFEKAVELAPYDATYLNGLARSYVALARAGDKSASPKAVGIADRIVDLDPNNAVVHYTRALVMQEIGRSQDAAQAIEAGARIRPRPPEAYVYQVAALAYLDLKRPQDAARWARSGIEANVSPEATTLHVLLAAALADSGDKEGAIGELDGVLVADPSERRARELLARVTKVDASRLLLTETFSALPKWVADGGADVGSVRNGILRAGSAGPNVWRVTVDGQDLPEVRVSLQFQLLGRPDERPAIEVGKRGPDGTAVSVLQQAPNLARTFVRIGKPGLMAEIARADLAQLERGQWYWLEVEFRPRTLTARLYRSGDRPVAKERASLLGAIRSDLPADAPREGAIYLQSTPVMIGGVGQQPGGLYIERLP